MSAKLVEVLCEAFTPTGNNPGGFKGLRDILELAPGRLHIEIKVFHGQRKKNIKFHFNFFSGSHLVKVVGPIIQLIKKCWP